MDSKGIVLDVSVNTPRGHILWHLNSGCARHMIGDSSTFSSFVAQECRILTFGDNGKGKVLGKGCIDKTFPTIENVYLVQGLKHNLLSISQWEKSITEIPIIT